jgi:hypothetical protein
MMQYRRFGNTGLRVSELFLGTMTFELGATEVATTVQRGARARTTAQRILVNGEPGIVAWSAKGRPLGVMACTVVAGRIVEILSVTDPKRLAAMDLPGRPDETPSS